MAVVRWENEATGEVKERPITYIEDGEEYAVTALELALALVPDLEVVIDMARMQGKSIEVNVRVF